MASITKYTNSSGERLTNQQGLSLPEYDKRMYINGVLKRIDTYYDNKIHSGVYYLSPAEDLQILLSELSAHWKFSNMYLDSQFFGSYEIKNWENY